MLSAEKRILAIFVIVFNALLLLFLGSRLPSLSARAAPGGIIGPCFVETTGDAVTDYSGDASALQAAVDAVKPGTTVRVAGECTGVQERSLLTQTLFISNSITIKGGYSDLNWTMPSDPEQFPTTISAAGKGRVILIAPSVTVTLDSLIIANGNAALGGGEKDGGGLGVFGTGIVRNTSIRENTADRHGGGVYIFGEKDAPEKRGSLHINASTIYSNTANADAAANGSGGGVYNMGELFLYNVTISGNSAYSGGGLANTNGGDANLRHVTLNDNTATKAEGDGGGGISNQLTSVISMMNSIIANSPSGGECQNAATFNDEGYNLVEDGSCTRHASSQSGDPQLGPLWDNGGWTLTHLPRLGSPAIDIIPNRTNGCGATNQTDQRGIPRPQGGLCDIGAVEIVEKCFVETSGDATTDYASEDASAVQSAVSDATPFSLLKVAGFCSGVQQIGFYIQSVAITESVMLQGGYTTTNWLSAPDPELYQTIIDGQGAGRVINIDDSPDVTIDRLTLSNGFSSIGSGLRNDSTGVVTVSHTIIKDNVSTVSGGGLVNNTDRTLILISSVVEGNEAVLGCGIYNYGTLTVEESTFDNNGCVNGFTAASGGGIYNNGSGVASVSNSTISNNSASASGGGIYNVGAMQLTNSTVSGNTHFSGGLGGGITNSGEITITFSTISDNWGGLSNISSAIITMESSIVANTGGLVACNNTSGTFIDLGYNLIEDGSCITEGTSLSGNPELGVLQDNGGNTETQALLSSSPVIDLIPFGTNGCGSVVGTDQRGNTRPSGSTCDLGAYEVSPSYLAFLPIVVEGP